MPNFGEYADAFDVATDANGDPVLNDPVTGDTMFRWDRSEGAFIPETIGTPADPVPGTSHLESVSTGRIVLNGLPVRSRGPITIADDSVQTLSLDQNNRRVHTLKVYSSTEDIGVFLVGFNSCQAIATKNMSSEGSADLTGTTGPDGSLNISVDVTDIHLENRTGSSVDVSTIESGRPI